MSEGHRKERWGHTASIMALLANINRDPKKHVPFSPADFMPREKSDAPVQKVEGLEVLKAAFVKPKR